MPWRELAHRASRGRGDRESMGEDRDSRKRVLGWGQKHQADVCVLVRD